MVRAWVQWPVVGLRALPGTSPSPWNGARWLRDPFHDSQVLYGDVVEVLARRGDWSWVAVPTQPCFRGGWQPYRGWVPHGALQERRGFFVETGPGWQTVRSWTVEVHASPGGPRKGLLGRGSRLPLLDGRPRQEWQELATGGWVKRADLQPSAESGSWDLESLAQDWLCTPYLWGGTSAYVPSWTGLQSGVDCSGLIWALWRALGRVIPRDAHDQWLLAKPLGQASELKLGDLVFFSGPEPRSRIHHVMLALDPERLIESSGSSGCVHFSSLHERCQTTPATRNGSWTGNYRIWFGRLPGEGSGS